VHVGSSRQRAFSSHLFALTLALNAGVRDAELRRLTWAQILFTKDYLVVGQSKTEAGEGRTIPLNSSLLPALREYAVWYQEKFGEARPEWYVFPFGRPRPSDPIRPDPSPLSRRPGGMFAETPK
jgi:integrase